VRQLHPGDGLSDRASRQPETDAGRRPPWHPDRAALVFALECALAVLSHATIGTKLFILPGLAAVVTMLRIRGPDAHLKAASAAVSQGLCRSG
jgi:hypothetical protein